jgi:DNA-binding transcriptional LysR family regulator
MHHSNIRDTNLNLLVALDALLEERHVTRASARIGLSQSGMSHALAQLRRIFDDPLFVRGRGGVEPTLRALELAEPVRRGLQAFSEALARPGDFDPTTSQERFTIAMNDYAELVLLPALMRRLAQAGPRISLQVVPAWGEVPEGLGRGELDVAVIGRVSPAPPGHLQRRLFDDEFVCIVRKGHPRIGRRLTLAGYLGESHVLVTQEPGALGIADRVLEKISERRHIGARVPRFFMVPALVAETDLIGLIDSRVARYFARQLPLRLLRPPLRFPPSPPDSGYHLVWHARSDRDPARTWLRNLITEVAAGV